MRLSTLDRYLLREITVPLVVGLGLFFVVVAFGQVMQVSDSVTGLGITGSAVLQALVYSLPPLMGLLLPVSLLFATMLGVGRLAADREVVGLCAGGITPYRLLRMPFLLGVLLACASAYALAVGEPWGIRGLRELMSRGAQQALSEGVRAGEFNEWIPKVTLLAERADRGKLESVLFADRRDADRPVLVAAKRGALQGGEQARDLVFDLRDGMIVIDDEENAVRRVIHFEHSLYHLDVDKLVRDKAKTLTTAQEKDLGTLWTERSDPQFSRAHRALLSITLHRKLALPLATIIFALVAVPLASTATPGARARGFLYSAGIVAAYYYVGRAAEIMARSGKLSPALAAWLPDLLGLVGMAILLVRFRRSAA